MSPGFCLCCPAHGQRSGLSLDSFVGKAGRYPPNSVSVQNLVNQFAADVGQACFAQHLQEQIEERVVRLLDFVEQEHGERLLPDLRREQSLAPERPEDLDLQRFLQVGRFTTARILV